MPLGDLSTNEKGGNFFGSVLTNKNTLRKESEIWLQMGFRFWGWCPPTIFLGLWRTTGWVVVVVVVRQVVWIPLTHPHKLQLLMSIHQPCLNYIQCPLYMSTIALTNSWPFLCHYGQETHNSPTTLLVKWVPTLLEMEMSSGQELPRPNIWWN